MAEIGVVNGEPEVRARHRREWTWESWSAGVRVVCGSWAGKWKGMWLDGLGWTRLVLAVRSGEGGVSVEIQIPKEIYLWRRIVTCQSFPRIGFWNHC